MKKGIEIPISTIVILAIAIIVLLAIVAWFMGAFTPSGQQISGETNFNNACLSWVKLNCEGNVPSDVCTAYNKTVSDNVDCGDLGDPLLKARVARACGCTV